MSEHRATIHWERQTPDFQYATYGRDHSWTFGTGTTLRASAAPEFKGNATLPNPEEALVAAASSCHMLTFLAVASRKGFVVDRYDDEATGVLAKNAQGKLAVTRATLHPRVVFGGEKRPTPDELARLHHDAHENCFIASSLRTEITVEPNA